MQGKTPRTQNRWNKIKQQRWKGWVATSNSLGQWWTPGSKAKGRKPKAQMGKLRGAWGRGFEAKARTGCVGQCWRKEIAEGVANSSQRRLHPMGTRYAIQSYLKKNSLKSLKAMTGRESKTSPGQIFKITPINVWTVKLYVLMLKPCKERLWGLKSRWEAASNQAEDVTKLNLSLAFLGSSSSSPKQYIFPLPCPAGNSAEERCPAKAVHRRSQTSEISTRHK